MIIISRLWICARMSKECDYNSEAESMSSDMSNKSVDMSSSLDESSEDVFNSYEPYVHEPLADNSEDDEQDEVDVDGILLTTIQDRYEGKEASNQWCTCGHCDSGLLCGPRQYRCCNDIEAAKQFQCEPVLQMQVICVTEHPDFNAVVLHPRVL